MMKSKSSSRRRERSPSDDSRAKRSKASSKSGEKEKIRKKSDDSRSKRAKARAKSSEREKISKKTDDSKSKRAKFPSSSSVKEKVIEDLDDSKSKRIKVPSKSAEKDKVRENPDDCKPKCMNVPPKTDEKDKIRENTKSVPRRTRWQAEDNKDSSKNAPIPEPAAEKEKPGFPLRIKDSLHDKEKLVHLLFQTVTGTALQELIPDYLKMRSNDELQKLCLEQLKLMSDETILQIISRKFDSINKEKVVEKEKILKPEQPSPSAPPKETEKQVVVQEPEKIPEGSNMDAVNKVSEDASQPQATRDEREIIFEENIPVVIKEEVAKDLLQPNRDAELLELEMRARAIRSLLKVKRQSPNKDETSTKEEK